MAAGALVALLVLPLFYRRVWLPAIADRWFWPTLSSGLVLRLAWLLTDGSLSSDALTYLTLAETIPEKGRYEIRGTRAYWPPGLPLALLATGSVVLLNGLIYLATAFLIHRLAGMWGVVAIAFWPTGIFLSWVPSKELLCLPLLLGAVHAFRCRRPAICGGLIGFAALTYSALIVFPLVFVFERQWRRLAIVAAVMLAVVSPWVVRNAVVVGVPTLGTNGGINLYIGNSPQAGGLFYEPHIPVKGELARNAWAKREALEWIAENPEKVAALSLKKLMLYFGDDDTGAYWSIKRGHGIDGAPYLAARAVSNLHWIVLLLLVYASAVRGARFDPVAVLPIGLGVAVAAVFFGHASHHIEFEGFIVMLALAGTVARSAAVAEARSDMVPASVRTR